MGDFFLRALGTLFLCGLCFFSWGASTDALKRPMVIHKVTALGLEIWTEANPEWEARLEFRNSQPVFIAETPALSTPPAGMSWAANPGIEFSAGEMSDGARGAMQQAAWNYGSQDWNRLELRPASYGDLAGYETFFPGVAYGMPVDVRMFCGHQPGKRAVVMHAFTLRGKLGQISEHVRRSWTHVRYLR